MSKVKITVLKPPWTKSWPGNTEQRALLPVPDEGGQIFYVDYAKPEGFCDGAWIAIHPYVFSLVMVREMNCFIMETGLESRGVAICSCNDGLQPVIFKVESAGQDSAMEYEPVR